MHAKSAIPSCCWRCERRRLCRRTRFHAHVTLLGRRSCFLLRYTVYPMKRLPFRATAVIFSSSSGASRRSKVGELLKWEALLLRLAPDSPHPFSLRRLYIDAVFVRAFRLFVFSRRDVGASLGVALGQKRTAARCSKPCLRKARRVR